MARESPVVVVGGGATGTAVARDLALRGVEVTLLERGPLAAGTSGRMHGLAHSGARYADSDPTSARACAVENRVLRKIAPHCLEPTGGLFAALPADDPTYVERKRAACESCGISVHSLDSDAARAMAPALSPAVERALCVPDAAVDPFRLTAATAAGAEAAGADIRTGVTVVDLLREGDRVVGVGIRPSSGRRHERLRASAIVNAAGPWAGRIAALADLAVDLRLVRGTMAVVEPRPVDVVVNRCRPRDEGDIIVPWGDAAVLGATATPIDDPDALDPPDGDAAGFLVEEAAAMVPAVAEGTVTRTFRGVRPLVAPADDTAGSTADASTAVGRDFRVLDHATRDGVAGLVSVVGGKLTTARLMAERAANRVCERLGVDARCRTAETPLPGADDEAAIQDALDRYDMPTARETRPW